MSLVLFRPKPPRKQWPTDNDWRRYRDVITQLYIHENRTLKEIVHTMGTEYNFHAKERMFKTRIKAWKLDKNLRTHEVVAMARVQAGREKRGTGSEFWRHGHPVTPGKLERFLRGHPNVAASVSTKIREDQTFGGYIEALLPNHIVVLEPSPPLEFDKDLRSTECMIFSIHAFMDPSSKSKWWLPKLEGEWSMALQSILSLMDNMDNRRPTPSRFQREATYLLQEKFNSTRGLLQSKGILSILVILEDCVDAITAIKFREITYMFLRHTRDICHAVNGTGHPLSVIFSTLFESQKNGRPILIVIKLLVQSIIDLLSKQTLPEDEVMVTAKGIWIRILCNISVKESEDVDVYIKKEIALLNANGEMHRQPLHLLYQVADLYWEDQNWAMCARYLEHIRQTWPNVLTARVNLIALYFSFGPISNCIEICHEIMGIWQPHRNRGDRNHLQSHHTGLAIFGAFTAVLSNLQQLGLEDPEIEALFKDLAQQIWDDIAGDQAGFVA